MYRSTTGISAFELVFRISSNEERKNASVQPIILIDEHAEEQEDLAWIVLRDGQVITLSLSPPYPATTARFDYTPLAAAIRTIDNIPHLAIYDRRKSQVVLITPPGNDRSLQVAKTSESLHTDRKPLHLCWTSDTMLILSDSIATIWIYEVTNDGIELVYEDRLHQKGIVSLSAEPSTEGDYLLVGQPNGCSSYRVLPHAFKNRSIELVSLDCLNNGSVRQILDTSEGLQYLCANNAGACVVDNHGEAVSASGAFQSIPSYF